MKNMILRRKLTAAAALIAVGAGAVIAAQSQAAPLSKPVETAAPLASAGYDRYGQARGIDALFPVGSGDQGVQADLAFQCSSFMRHTAYRHESSLDNSAAPSGAYGANKAFESGETPKLFIEEQRPGGDLILGSIANHDTAGIDQGIKILQWGFNHQNSDGSFQTEDPFHSSSFFVEATAHAMLDLQASQYGGQYASTISDFSNRLDKAAHWMISPDVESRGIRKNQPFGHRRYLVAAALGETGLLCHDDSLIQESKKFIRDGLSFQSPEGYNPEKGGADSSYNAAGILFADQYYTMVASQDLRPPLLNMLNKCAAWEVGQVLPSGEVNTAGNTRVGGADTESDRSGVKKHVASSIVLRCLAYYSQISGDPNSLAAATNVAAFYRMYKP